MSITIETLKAWLQSPENERLEFKAARQTYQLSEVQRYLVALANEGGGHLVLGVTDEMPRSIVGTAALPDHARHAHELTRQLGLRVTFTELQPPEGRVLIASVGARHHGLPVAYRGQYLMRVGESLVPMTSDQLKAVFAESVPDPSALPVSGARFSDLDPHAIQAFRELWAAHAARRVGLERAAEIRGMSDRETVERANLKQGQGITLAALVLLGSEIALDRLLSNAEIIYEFRERQGDLEARVRQNIRQAFFLEYDNVWSLIADRNSFVEIPAGMLRMTIPAFNERSVREALMNAVAHRDYQRPESVFIRHNPEQLEVESPGGLPPTVTVETVLDRQVPRNRLIAENLERVGLVERSGQGADIMFREAIREAKPLPSFAGTDDSRVVVTQFSTIRDLELVRAMDVITRDELQVYDVRDFLIIDYVAREDAVPQALLSRVPRLIENGILERVGRRRLVLSRRLYEAAGRKGAYTRAVGLDRQAQVELAHQHLRQAGVQGAPIGELMEVFPGLTRYQVFELLDTLRRLGRADVRGQRRTARWFAIEPD